MVIKNRINKNVNNLKQLFVSTAFVFIYLCIFRKFFNVSYCVNVTFYNLSLAFRLFQLG